MQKEESGCIVIPRLFLKNEVHINGAHFYPEMTNIINVLRATIREEELSDGAIWITSANDGLHMGESLHYENKAFDVRIRNVLGGIDNVRNWVSRISLALGKDYDIVLESDHIHCEYDVGT